MEMNYKSLEFSSFISSVTSSSPSWATRSEQRKKKSLLKSRGNKEKIEVCPPVDALLNNHVYKEQRLEPTFETEK